jgi:hypothetical protein
MNKEATDAPVDGAAEPYLRLERATIRCYRNSLKVRL